jgi:hypothetical protein
MIEIGDCKSAIAEIVPVDKEGIDTASVGAKDDS